MGQQADPQEQPLVICISSEGADDVFDAYLLDSDADQPFDDGYGDSSAGSGDGSERGGDDDGMLRDATATCMESWAEEQLVGFEI